MAKFNNDMETFFSAFTPDDATLIHMALNEIGIPFKEIVSNAGTEIRFKVDAEVNDKLLKEIQTLRIVIHRDGKYREEYYSKLKKYQGKLGVQKGSPGPLFDPE